MKARAGGLYDCFIKGRTLLALMMSVRILSLLENLCTALQGRRTTITGMMAAVNDTKCRLQALRADKEFDSIYRAAEQSVDDYNLDPIVLPRYRRPPKRFDAGSQPHVFKDASSFFKQEYLMLVDNALEGLAKRFDQHSFMAVEALEKCLTTGTATDVTANYPELDKPLLAV